MRERPILFSAPMVRALLDGTKSQTRRVCKTPPIWEHTKPLIGSNAGTWSIANSKHSSVGFSGYAERVPQELLDALDALSPYGAAGDRLWVRENGWERPARTPKMMREGADTWAPYYFDADGLSEQESADFKAWGFKRRPSIHMPRVASRILLEVTQVRVQRLQEIGAVDALEEGSPRLSGLNPQVWYRGLWDTINGHNRAITWGANPWVWAVSFKRIKP